MLNPKNGGKYNFVFVSRYGYTCPWNRESQDIQAWATVMKGDLLFKGFPFSILRALSYNIIMLELTEDMFTYSKNLLKKKKHQKIIGVIEGSPHYLIEKFNLKHKLDFLQIINQVDGLATIVENTNSFYQALTTQPVFFLGVPVPVEKTKNSVIPFDQKQKSITIVSGVNLPSGGITNLAAFLEIKKERNIPIKYFLTDKKEMQSLKKFNINAEIIIGRFIWEDFIRKISSSYIVLNMDFRWTWGRLACDCAALGIPSIGTFNSHSQKILFPKLCVDPFDIQNAKKLAQKLLNSKDFYQECSQYAQKKVEQFNFTNAKKNFLQNLKRI